MLNKAEFTDYAQMLLACCSVELKNSTSNETVDSFTNGIELARYVFDNKESDLTLLLDGMTIGCMTLTVEQKEGNPQVCSFSFACSELSVPNMAHFARSEDKEQENRATITQYLEKLLQEHTVSFGDNDTPVIAIYNHHGSASELAERLFGCEVSRIAIDKNGESLGVIHFAGEYNDKRMWSEGEPYDFLDVYAFSTNNCRHLLPQNLVSAA